MAKMKGKSIGMEISEKVFKFDSSPGKGMSDLAKAINELGDALNNIPPKTRAEIIRLDYIERNKKSLSP